MKRHQLLVKFKSGLVGSLLLFLLLPNAAFGQTVSLEAGTDRMGGDYKSFELAGPQPALCQQACANDAACKAFTYVKPGVQARRAMCFLKSSVPPATPNECCTSGTRAAGGRPGPIIIQRVNPLSVGRPLPINVTRPAPRPFRTPVPDQPDPAPVITSPSTINPLIIGPVQLNPNQLELWKLMVLTAVKAKPAVTGLWVLQTSYKASPVFTFPQPAGVNYVYSNPLPLRLLARVEGTAAIPMNYVLQISTESTTLNLTPPYAGWDKPAGLIWQDTLKNQNSVSVPDDPEHAGFHTAPMDGAFGSPLVVNLGSGGKYTYIDTTLPHASAAAFGTTFYVRVVPMVANKIKTPAAPPSNWVKFYVAMSQSEQIQWAEIELAKQQKRKADELARFSSAVRFLVPLTTSIKEKKNAKFIC